MRLSLFANDTPFEPAALPPRARNEAANQAGIGARINGRFLAQSVTGVQRYARMIVQSLDKLIDPAMDHLELVAPPIDIQTPPLANIPVLKRGLNSGPFWEQTALIRSNTPILNLCNTAPVFTDKNIVCIHDCNIFSAPDSYSWLFRSYYRCLQPVLAKRITRLVTVSQYSAKALASRFGIDERRISLAPNGCDHALDWDAGRSSLRASDIADETYILMIGSVARHKNVDLVLNLAAELDELGVKIKVVGASATAFAHVVATRASNIEWLGRVSDNDLAFLLDNALCLAFPSLNEGFGLPPLEAMARGCPVVVSNTCSLPEVCGEAALYASPSDRDLWLKHFRDLVNSPRLRSTLAEKGIRRSRHYSWTSSARVYLELLRDTYA